MAAMLSISRLLLLAAAVVATLAAPTQPQPQPQPASINKRSFTVPIVRANGFKEDPVQAMQHAARKYGWEIVVLDPQASPIATITTVLHEMPAPTHSADAIAASSAGDASAPSSVLAMATSAIVKPEPSPGNVQQQQQQPSNMSAPSPGSDGAKVSAVPEQNESEYLSPVTIGGGQQTFNLDFDTGSADLWVFSVNLPTAQRSGHPLFDPSKSSTWKPYQDGAWQILYGDGSGAYGTVGFDTVNVGGATVPNQAIELANQVDASFMRDVNNDGLLGLAFSSINTISPQPQKTFFENLKPHLTAPLFTVDLEDDAAGTYEFGRIDSSKYKGQIQYTPIDKSRGFWQFPSPSFSISGGGGGGGGGSSSGSNVSLSSTATRQQCQTCSAAIADTGTSLMLVDSDIAAAYYARVAGARLDRAQGGYTYPCTSTMPDLGVALGDANFVTLKGSQTTYKKLGDGSCFGGIQGNQGQGVQIFGDVFFKQFFAVFDGTDGQERFGVARKDK